LQLVHDTGSNFKKTAEKRLNQPKINPNGQIRHQGLYVNSIAAKNTPNRHIFHINEPFQTIDSPLINGVATLRGSDDSKAPIGHT